MSLFQCIRCSRNRSCRSASAMSMTGAAGLAGAAARPTLGPEAMAAEAVGYAGRATNETSTITMSVRVRSAVPSGSDDHSAALAMNPIDARSISATNPSYTYQAILTDWPPIAGAVGAGLASKCTFTASGTATRATSTTTKAPRRGREAPAARKAPREPLAAGWWRESQ